MASKYDVYLNVPTRQSASITKESVCHINNNVKYGNDATPTFVTDFQANSAQAIAANHISSQNQLAVLSRKSANASARPTQLFWELRFNALNSVDVNDIDSSLVKPLDLELVNLSKCIIITIRHLLIYISSFIFLFSSQKLEYIERVGVEKCRRLLVSQPQ